MAVARVHVRCCLMSAPGTGTPECYAAASADYSEKTSREHWLLLRVHERTSSRHTRDMCRCYWLLPAWASEAREPAPGAARRL